MRVQRWVTLSGCGVIAGGLVLASVIQAPAARVLRTAEAEAVPAPAPGNPVPEYQLTRVQIDVFELLCPHDRLADFELDRIGAGQPTAREVLTRLSELGTARLLIRYDNMVDLAQPIRVSSGAQIPAVEQVVVNSGGAFTPSVAYQDVGFIMAFSGRWRDDEDPLQAEIRFRIGCSDLADRTVKVAEGLMLPTFTQRFSAEQTRAVKSGHPVWLAVNDLQLTAPAQAGTAMTLVRLTATRMQD